MTILLGILSSFNKNKIHRQNISKAKKYHVSEASARFFKCASTSPFCHYCHFGKFCDIGHWSLSALSEIDDDVGDDFLSCISDWNLTEHWLEMTMATIRSS